MAQSAVFVSYCRRDGERVGALVERLQRAGISVWVDREGIEAASQWSRAIVEALDEAPAVLLIASSESFASEHVTKEVLLAAEEQKPILPIYLEPTKPPAQLRYQLAGIQHVEYFEDGDSEAFAQILRALRSAGVERQHAPSKRADGSGALVRTLVEFEDAGESKRLFLFGQDCAGFGIAKRESMRTVDMTLRVLPARSPDRDPENWRANLMLSSHHGNLVLRDNQLHLEDASTNGILVYPEPTSSRAGDVSAFSERRVTLHAESPTAAFSAPVEVRRPSVQGLRMNRTYPIQGQLHFALGPGLLHLHARVIGGEGGAVPRALHVTRTENAPSHGYLQLIRWITLGDSPASDIGFRDGLGGSPRIRIERGEAGFAVMLERGRASLDGAGMEPGEKRPLPRTAELVVGDKLLRVRPAQDRDFTSL